MDSHLYEQKILNHQLLNLLQEFGHIGRTATNGISRLTASPEDKQARDHLCQWLKDHGLTVLVDAIGNIFGVLDLDTKNSNTAFFCGSHLDSQPNGGNYDGCLGVVCASIAALDLKEKVARNEISPTFRYYVVACWTGEEGARFQPSLIGSSVFSGNLSVDDAWLLQDSHGISLKDALKTIGYLGNDRAPRPGFYLELHIEQGTRLEDSGHSIGLVETCWGAEKLRILIKGEAAHTGPTPMDRRRNALLAASQIVLEVETISTHAKNSLHSSVGRMKLSPNSPNTVVENAELWAEFRSASQAELDSAKSHLKDHLARVGEQTGCEISITNHEKRNVIRFDQAAVSQAAMAIDKTDIPYQRLDTISGHDAIRLQAVCPSALLFVPSRGGITHSPKEYTSNEDVCTGFRAMTTVLARLISQTRG